MPPIVELLGMHLRRKSTCHPQLRHEGLRQRVAGSLPGRLSMLVTCHLEGVEFVLLPLNRVGIGTNGSPPAAQVRSAGDTSLLARSFCACAEFRKATSFEHILHSTIFCGSCLWRGHSPEQALPHRRCDMVTQFFFRPTCL